MAMASRSFWRARSPSSVLMLSAPSCISLCRAGAIPPEKPHGDVISAALLGGFAQPGFEVLFDGGDTLRVEHAEQVGTDGQKTAILAEGVGVAIGREQDEGGQAAGVADDVSADLAGGIARSEGGGFIANLRAVAGPRPRDLAGGTDGQDIAISQLPVGGGAICDESCKQGGAVSQDRVGFDRAACFLTELALQFEQRAGGDGVLAKMMLHGLAPLPYQLRWRFFGHGRLGRAQHGFGGLDGEPRTAIAAEAFGAAVAIGDRQQEAAGGIAWLYPADGILIREARPDMRSAAYAAAHDAPLTH